MNSSMINPSIVDLLKKVDNRYTLVIVTSKRARQLIDTKDVTQKIDCNKALTKAIHEVNDNEVVYEYI